MGRQAGDLRGLRMHDVQRTAVAAGAKVGEQRRADGVRAARGADDGDGRRAQDVLDGRDRRDAVAVLEALDGLGVERGGHLEVQFAAPYVHVDREPGVAEHLRHAVIGRVHGRREGGDAVALRGLREMGEQDRADAQAALVLVDLEGDLRAIGRDADVRGVPDDPFRGARGGDETEAAIRRLDVVLGDGADANGRAVAKGDVDGDGRFGDGHPPAAALPSAIRAAALSASPAASTQVVLEAMQRVDEHCGRECCACRSASAGCRRRPGRAPAG